VRQCVYVMAPNGGDQYVLLKASPPRSCPIMQRIGAQITVCRLGPVRAGRIGPLLRSPDA
jgi:hypothetical protein